MGGRFPCLCLYRIHLLLPTSHIYNNSRWKFAVVTLRAIQHKDHDGSLNNLRWKSILVAIWASQHNYKISTQDVYKKTGT